MGAGQPLSVLIRSTVTGSDRSFFAFGLLLPAENDPKVTDEQTDPWKEGRLVIFVGMPAVYNRIEYNMIYFTILSAYRKM